MLESIHLTKNYLNKKALDDVSLKLEEGQIYALLGPNGSGKTTWMKTAAGLTKPTSGEMLYNGSPVGIESRREIAYMSTEPYFFRWMTVEDVGEYFQDFFDDFSSDIYRELLAEMALTEDMKIRQLSSGMAAKLKIAATMARKASVFLLDEPLNGIDLIARDRIMEAVISSVEPNVTLVISSHLVEEIESFASKAVFLRNGHAVEVCDVEDLRVREGKSLAYKYREIME